MLEQFWTFARAAEALFTDSLGYQMGFARCSKIPRERPATSIAQFQRDLAIRALAAPVLAPASKKKPGAQADNSTNTPLLNMENAEKQRWAKRLRAIAERAGAHADPDRSASSDGILSDEEKARLQLLESGDDAGRDVSDSPAKSSRGCASWVFWTQDAGFHLWCSLDHGESYSPFREVRALGTAGGDRLLSALRRQDP